MRARGWRLQEGGWEAGTHLVDPVDVGGHAGVDSGLLEGVAAQARAEAHDAPHLPGAVLGLAVQWAAGVSLHQTGSVSPRPPSGRLGKPGRAGVGAVGSSQPWCSLFWPQCVHGEGGREEVAWGYLGLILGGPGMSMSS